MIAKMSKYNFILYAAQKEDFIAHLRELGLVDITTTGWEPTEDDRVLLSDIEGYRRAVEALEQFAASDRFVADAEPYASGRKAYEAYRATMAESAAFTAEIARLEKTADEMRPWGDFAIADVKALAEKGVTLRFFSMASSAFEKSVDEWSATYAIDVVNEVNGYTYFVVVTRAGEGDVTIDAQEMKAPSLTYKDAETAILKQSQELLSLDAQLSRCAVSIADIKAEECQLKERLQGVKVTATASSAADGALVVMEAWAEKESSKRVDAMLDAYSNIIYLKSAPTPEDDTPVKLKNNKFARLFELIGAMYAFPKYGTMDLTAFFAPFYMLFFGICLGDAGYGLVLMLGAWLLLRKGSADMAQAARLAMLCGASTVLFGFAIGSFFGINLATVPMFEGFHFIDFQNQFFPIALALGIVQILFGMLLKIIMTSSAFGFKYALSTLGWFIIVLSSSVAMGLSKLNDEWVIPFFNASSPAFYVALAVGVLLMFFCNSPGKNIFLNFGTGLWDTYNNVSGLLGDVLSYIRLFAIGLSGGILAQVFNSLADGLSPDGNIFVKLLVMIPILLLGHGINIFMSALSSFVHPMRLTFVEFYKNAGFEMTTRLFDPIKKYDNQENK